MKWVPLLRHELNERTFSARREGRRRNTGTKLCIKAGCKLRSTSFQNSRTIRLLSVKLRESRMTSLEEIKILGINELEEVEEEEYLRNRLR